jgi:hypothetical protein
MPLFASRRAQETRSPGPASLKPRPRRDVSCNVPEQHEALQYTSHLSWRRPGCVASRLVRLRSAAQACATSGRTRHVCTVIHKRSLVFFCHAPLAFRHLSPVSFPHEEGVCARLFPSSASALREADSAGHRLVRVQATPGPLTLGSQATVALQPAIDEPPTLGEAAPSEWPRAVGLSLHPRRSAAAHPTRSML